MIGRVAMYLVPSAAVVITALVVLGPGAPRPAFAVRVRGAPAEGGKVLALRLIGFDSVLGVEEPVRLEGLRVHVTTPAGALDAEASTGPDGIGEVRLEAPAPLVGPVGLRVEQARPGGRPPLVLAEGLLRLRAQAGAVERSTVLKGTAHGDLPVEVRSSRGVLAAPFPEALLIQAGPSVELDLSVNGGDVSPEHLTTDAQGRASARVKPLAHGVELTVEARARDGKKGTWEGTLPVVPGAFWIDPASPPDRLSVVSPAPRPSAYLSLWSDAERIDGAIVPLRRDPDGFFRGEVAVRTAATGAPAVPGATGPYAPRLHATVAGDPLEQGTGTVDWPLRSPGPSFVPLALEQLVDGMPLSLAREQARARRARRTGIFLVAAGALAEILLLVLRTRAAQRRLDTHLARASADDDGDGLGAPSPAMSAEDRARLLSAGREHPVLWAIAFAVMVGFAFAMVAAVATFR